MDLEKLKRLHGLAVQAPWHTHSEKRLGGGVFATVDGVERQVAGITGQAITFNSANPDVTVQAQATIELIIELRNMVAALCEREALVQELLAAIFHEDGMDRDDVDTAAKRVREATP